MARGTLGPNRDTFSTHRPAKAEPALGSCCEGLPSSSFSGSIKSGTQRQRSKGCWETPSQLIALFRAEVGIQGFRHTGERHTMELHSSTEFLRDGDLQQGKCVRAEGGRAGQAATPILWRRLGGKP